MLSESILSSESSFCIKLLYLWRHSIVREMPLFKISIVSKFLKVKAFWASCSVHSQLSLVGWLVFFFNQNRIKTFPRLLLLSCIQSFILGFYIWSQTFKIECKIGSKLSPDCFCWAAGALHNNLNTALSTQSVKNASKCKKSVKMIQMVKLKKMHTK